MKHQKWSKLEAQQMVNPYDLGGVLSTAGTVASAIPNPITQIAGIGLNLIGSIVSGNTAKKEAEKQRKLEEMRQTEAKLSALPAAKGGIQGGIVNPFALALGGYIDSPFLAKSGIYIKPSKKGTFTAAASKHGKSVQAFASQVLANKGNYSSAMVKKANFAKNASKWHHAEGGYIEGEPVQGQGLQTSAPVEFVPGANTQWFSESAALSKYKMLKDAGNTEEAEKLILGYYANEPFGPYKEGTHAEYTKKGKIKPITFTDLVNLDTKKYKAPKDFLPLLDAYRKSLGSKLALGGYVNPLALDNMDFITYKGGGTHRQNPLGGIPVGTGLNGKQNTVESGETSFKFKEGKYVFSNRLRL